MLSDLIVVFSLAQAGKATGVTVPWCRFHSTWTPWVSAHVGVKAFDVFDAGCRGWSQVSSLWFEL